jgi:TonB family protein
MLLIVASFRRILVLIQYMGARPMRSLVVSAVLGVAFAVAPVATGYAPAMSQDFSITNQMESADPVLRDVMRQLQAWLDVHAYYPRHASNNDEGGIVKVHLRILADGRIWMATLAGSSGSRALDAAGATVFRDGFVRPLPDGSPDLDIDIGLHYVLAHRHDQPVAAS